MDNTIGSTHKIKTRQDFALFVNNLLADLHADKSDWENKSLESFLEALSSYAEDINGFYKSTNQSIDADKASWKVFADMLMGARIYE